ncbi:MAG: hypothetical protein GX465_00680 [Acidobacteria bacterium]|nr:hypothetical protein [Acidobacteriota bacterium]
MKKRMHPQFCLKVGGLSLFSLLIFFLFYGPLLASHQETGIDWNKVQEAFKSYINDPSIIHGHELVRVLPTTRHVLGEMEAAYKDRLATLSLIFAADCFSQFIERVRGGDRYAIEAAFRIFNFTDGGASEEIMIILGDSLRENPLDFLIVAKKHKKLSNSEDYLAPAIMTRYEVGSDLETSELRLRLKALESVDEPGLFEVRRALIEEISKALRDDLPEKVGA